MNTLARFPSLTLSCPRYLKGHFINFGCLVGLLVIGIILPLYMKRENKKRSQGERGFRLDESQRDGLSAEEHEFRLGWMHPSFRFKF